MLLRLAHIYAGTIAYHKLFSTFYSFCFHASFIFNQVLTNFRYYRYYNIPFTGDLLNSKNKTTPWIEGQLHLQISVNKSENKLIKKESDDANVHTLTLTVYSLLHLLWRNVVRIVYIICMLTSSWVSVDSNNSFMTFSFWIQSPFKLWIHSFIFRQYWTFTIGWLAFLSNCMSKLYKHTYANTFIHGY